MASDDRKAEISQGPGYMVELQLENQLVVILGGGRIAQRKLPDLLSAGAKVDLIDPAALSDLPQHPQLTHFRRNYQPSDLDRARLVFAATNNPQTNARIAADAAQQKIFCCRVDSVKDSSFSTPARLLRPPLSFALSSGGQNPAMSAALRELLAGMIPPSWPLATRLTTAIRQKILTTQLEIPYNQQVLLRLFEQGLFELLEHSDGAGLDRLLLKHFGAGFSLENLRFSLPEGTP